MIPLQEFERLMKPIHDYRLEFENVEKGLTLLCGSTLDFDLGGRLLDAYIKLVQEKVNDPNDLIIEFVFCQAFGKEKVKVQYRMNGEKKTIWIKDIKSLYKLLSEEEKE